MAENKSFWAGLLGASLGWALGGPIGGILGGILGSAFVESNRKFTDSDADPADFSGPRSNGDFSISLLVLCAAVVKADGRVLKGELDFIKEFYKRQFGEAIAKERILILRDLLKEEIPVRDVCFQIKQHLQHAERLQLMHLLFGLALSDQHLDTNEISVIKNIATWLGISDADFASLLAMFRKNDPDSAYKILEVDKTATEEELKKAYRKMAVKYHPDKVAHLGEEYQKDAAEKFKSVQNAWETIKKERKIV